MTARTALEQWHELHDYAVARGADRARACRIADTGAWTCVRCSYPIPWPGACEVCAAFVRDDGTPRP